MCGHFWALPPRGKWNAGRAGPLGPREVTLVDTAPLCAPRGPLPLREVTLVDTHLVETQRLAAI